MSRDIHTRAVRSVVQCIAHTRTGARCKRRTRRTNLCYAHLEKEQHLRIKKSSIPGAGMGLYTTIPRRKNRMVAPYTGEYVTKPQNNFGGDYVISLNSPPNAPPYKYVDARKTTDGAGRFANNARRSDQKTNNSHLSANANSRDAKVVASRNIPAGSEILAKYGAQYWGSRR